MPNTLAQTGFWEAENTRLCFAFTVRVAITSSKEGQQIGRSCSDNTSFWNTDTLPNFCAARFSAGQNRQESPLAASDAFRFIGVRDLEELEKLSTYGRG